MKTCTGCNLAKTFSDFGKHKAGKDGIYARCKACEASRVAAYSKANSAKNKARALAWYKENTVKAITNNHAYKVANRAAVRAKESAYNKAHPEQRRAHNANRRASRRRATPPWFSELDAFAIQEAYSLATRREAITSFAWHVDHVIPLRGLAVCGLHIGKNLQVIPATLNLRKHNKYPV